ncbi:unnamed protein product [Enterobius vermicularis]|uniref:Transmembrane protein n=1 Tax=Enterobius vermicularis TaxID=51028 RepID=A0A0N4UVU3_ENTVE|nr:unnamed protein product [Enterobius vermicularis]
MAPSSRDLKEMRLYLGSGKNRKRKADRNSDSNGFLVPKNAQISLTPSLVSENDTSLLPWYSVLCWVTDYFPFAIMIYFCSEVYRFFYPDSQAINVSIIWILLLTAFVLQALASMTSTLFFGDVVEGERNVIVSFAALFFFFSMIFLMFSESYFDIGFNKAYEAFIKTTSDFFVASDLPDIPVERSPVLLFITLSMLFAFLGAMLVFPNFRYARMYACAVKEAEPLSKFLYHIAFFSQYFSLFLFTHPVKNYILHGPYKMLTASHLNSLRIWSVITSMFLRVLVRRAHLQSHLNLAAGALNEIRSQSGNINSLDLQKMVFRYYTYLNVATLQYFLPPILPLTFALLLKTLGNYSWIGKELLYVEMRSESSSLASLTVLLGPSVQQGIWTLFLVISLLHNCLLSLIGFFYNTYIVEA